MTRSYLILMLLAVLFGTASCNSTPEQQTPQKTNPNVLFIAIDDLNDWLGCMNGHPNAKTPNMDRLADQGVLFTNAHCQAPLCGPSRASLMTGLRPSTTGIYGMIDDDKIKSDNPATADIKFLPEYFKEQGYYTMGIGKLFHEHAPQGLFDESGGRYKGFGPVPEERFVWDGYGSSDRDRYGRTSTDWGAFPSADSLMPDHQSADWVIDRLQRGYQQPFFMAVGFLRPHVPLYAPQKWFDLHPVENLEMPPYKPDDLDDVPPVALQLNDLPMMPTTEWAIETGEWPNIVQAYLACVSFVDHQVGRIMEALENSAYADNTVIVLWSDHGYRLGEKGTFAKQVLWEPATNAPLMFAGAGVPQGKVLDHPVEMLSIYPTLLELCNLPAYQRNEGKSLVTLMTTSSPDQDLFAITTFGMNNHGVRTGNFRYIQYEDGLGELYDFRRDPEEWENLFSNQDYQQEVQSHKALLPPINVNWNQHSNYGFQPYFGEQKARTRNKE